ncbi:MAG: NYN domain-containing protein, partial [Methanobacteriota archaeon]
LGRLVNRNGVYVEKGVDIYLAVDMLRYAFDDTYDTAILVSGDGDFASAVSAVRDLGKHVEHAYFRTGESIHLRESCDVRVDLDAGFLKPCFIA